MALLTVIARRHWPAPTPQRSVIPFGAYVARNTPPAVLEVAAWEHRRFVATFQFYSIFVNLASLAAKGGLPQISPTALVVSFAGLAVGVAGGQILARHVDHEAARRLAIALALAGALVTVVKGALAW